MEGRQRTVHPRMQQLFSSHLSLVEYLKTVHQMLWALGAGIAIGAVLIGDTNPLGPLGLLLVWLLVAFYFLYQHQYWQCVAELEAKRRAVVEPLFGDDHRAAQAYVREQKRLSGRYPDPRDEGCRGSDPDSWLALR